MRLEIISDVKKFFSFSKDWNIFLGRSNINSIFLSHGWLRCWWESFGSRKQLMVILCRDNEHIFAAAPLMKSKINFRLFPAKVISFIENDESPFCDFLFEKGANPTSVLRDFLLSCTSYNTDWDILKFRKIPQNSQAVSQLITFCKNKYYPFLVRPSLRSPVIAINTDWETFYAGKTQRFKKRIRHQLNKIKKIGKISVEEVHSVQEIEKLIEEIFRIGSKSWKAKKKVAISSTAEKRSFFLNLPGFIEPMAEVYIWLLKLCSKPIAFEYHIRQDDTVYALRSEFDEDYRSFAPGAVLDFNVVRNLFSKGIKHYNMCGGSDEYKLRWTSNAQLHCDIIVFNNTRYGKTLFFLEDRIIPALKNLKTKKFQ